LRNKGGPSTTRRLFSTGANTCTISHSFFTNGSPYSLCSLTSPTHLSQNTPLDFNHSRKATPPLSFPGISPPSFFPFSTCWRDMSVKYLWQHPSLSLNTRLVLPLHWFSFFLPLISVLCLCFLSGQTSNSCFLPGIFFHSYHSIVSHLGTSPFLPFLPSFPFELFQAVHRSHSFPHLSFRPPPGSSSEADFVLSRQTLPPLTLELPTSFSQPSTPCAGEKTESFFRFFRALAQPFATDINPTSLTGEVSPFSISPLSPTSPSHAPFFP